MGRTRGKRAVNTQEPCHPREREGRPRKRRAVEAKLTARNRGLLARGDQGEAEWLPAAV